MFQLVSGQPLLPRRFAPLEPFVAYWAVDDETLRATRRDRASVRDCAVFDAAVAVYVPLALAYLDRLPLDQQGAAERRLRNLLLGHAHAVQVLRCQAGRRSGDMGEGRRRPH